MLCDLLKGTTQLIDLKVGNKKLEIISVGNAQCLLHYAQVMYMRCLCIIIEFASDRVSKVCSTQASVSKFKKNLAKLSSNLKKDEVVQKLDKRLSKVQTVDESFTYKLLEKDLQKLLIKEMHEIKRLPVILFQNPTNNLDQFCLQHYEILNKKPPA